MLVCACFEQTSGRNAFKVGLTCPAAAGLLRGLDRAGKTFWTLPPQRSPGAGRAVPTYVRMWHIYRTFFICVAPVGNGDTSW